MNEDDYEEHDDIPEHLPPLPRRIPRRIPPHGQEDWTKPPQLHPTTRVPRVFGICGTICYGISAIASITCLLTMGFTGWVPPWYFLMPVFLYTFVSTGIITYGRIENNRDSKVYIRSLQRVSEENKRRMN